MTGTTTAPGTRPRDRRTQLLSHAADLFAARGFASVSVQEIGEQAGVSGAAIYRHFPGKDALLHELLVENIDTWVLRSTEARDAARAAGEPPLHRMVDAIVDLVVHRSGRLATYLRERSRADAATLERIARGERDLGRCWSEAILELRPDLTRAEVAARQHAVNGVLSALCRRPAALESPRARALVTTGLVAVVTAAHRDDAEVGRAGPPAWDAPVSRRQQILDTAMALFATRGFDGVGLNEVGEVLGIAGPSIYEHFASKAMILLDAYDQAGALVAAGATSALRAADGPSAALDALVASFVEVAYGNVELITVTSREGGSLPREERPRLVRRRRELHDSWLGVLRQLRPELSPSEAHVLVRVAFPLITQVARQARDRHSAAATSALAQVFLLAEEPQISQTPHPLQEEP